MLRRWSTVAVAAAVVLGTITLSGCGGDSTVNPLSSSAVPAVGGVSARPFTISVKAGQSLAAAVASAPSGSLINVGPGVFNEAIFIHQSHITLQGSPGTIIDGTGLAATTNGIEIDPPGTPPNTTPEQLPHITDVNVQGISIRNFGGNNPAGNANAIFLNSVDTYNVSGNTLVQAVAVQGAYGVFPVHTTNGTINNNTVSGFIDTGIYIGQSSNVLCSGNNCFGNNSGYEIEDCNNVTMTGNIATDNTTGILCFSFPSTPDVVQDILTFFGNQGNVISFNTVLHNNQPPIAAASDIVSTVPPGTGMFVLANDGTQVIGNDVEQNATLGILISDLATVVPIANAIGGVQALGQQNPTLINNGLPIPPFANGAPGGTPGFYVPNAYDPSCNQTLVAGNKVINNGPSNVEGATGDAARVAYAEQVLGLPQAAAQVAQGFFCDLSWDGIGASNTWPNNQFNTAFNFNLETDPTGATTLEGPAALPTH